MDRRSFLKALGVGGGASALAACGLDDNQYYTPIEDVLPYVARPEQVTPGTNSYFATTVGSGPHAYPNTAVHRDGRVINVGANQQSKWHPAVAGAAYFELQRHFSPDRITSPTKGGAAVEWTAAVDELANAVKQARSGGKKVVWVGPYRSGAIADLLDTFTDGNAIHFEALGRDAEAKAAQKVFGSPALPKYDLAKAHYVLSFGASFMGGSWGGPGTEGDYATARNANHGGFVARFAAVTPMKDQTAANADDWYACTPGTEAQVCLAIAKLVAKKTGKGGAAAKAVASADENAAAAAAGLTVEHLTEIAEHFAHGHAVALPGGIVGASANAVELAAATYLLNLVGGSKDTFMAGGYRGHVHGFDDVQKLIEDMKGGKVGVLLIDDVDLVHHLPNGADFAAAMGSVPMTVAVTSHPNETTATAGMVLPTHSVFEDWGVEEPMANVYLVRQPGQLPLHGTMSLGDVLLRAWSKAGMGPLTSFHAFVKSYLAAKVYAPEPAPSEDEVEGGDVPAAPPADGEEGEVIDPITTQAFARWFEGVLKEGVAIAKPAARAPLRATGGVTGGNAEAMGNGDKFLVAFPHPFLLDGRFANQPWAQEMPDPMTGQVWDTWALVHPATAEALGVSDNDLIKLDTGSGSIEVGVEVHPCVHPDVIAVPTGGGHTRASGRYADAVGQNVASILPATAAGGGTQIWQSKVTASKGSGKADLVSTFGNDSDRDRGWVATCSADAYAKAKDEPAHHPGEMTGIHHLELDERLQEQGVGGFYPIPDHPTYRFGLTVDTNLCNGCGACAVACYAENNLPVVGKHKVKEGREMSWIRVNRYFKQDAGITKDHGVEHDTSVHFTPLMCQQCGHAPCESVCPVLATYHSIDGLNAMVYNRCAGTRYCSNACPYSARKFNYHTYVWPEPFNLQLNPDVVTRTMGVMEKCSFCVQRLRRTKSAYRDQGFKKTVPAEELSQLVACAEACPSQALTFGNINDETSAPNFTRKSGRNFIPIADINTYPAVNYLAKASFYFEPGHHGGGGDHGGDHAEGGHGGDHGDAHEGGHAEEKGHGADKSHEPAHDAH